MIEVSALRFCSTTESGMGTVVPSAETSAVTTVVPADKELVAILEETPSPEARTESGSS